MLMSRMDLEEISSMPNSLILRKLISMSGSQYEQDLIDLGYIVKLDDKIKVTKNGMQFIREIRNTIHKDIV